MKSVACTECPPVEYREEYSADDITPKLGAMVLREVEQARALGL